MEEINNLPELPSLPKKKLRKLRIFSVLFIIIFGISLILFYSQYRDSINDERENIISNLDNRVDLGELQKVEVSDVQDFGIHNPLTSVNPRHSYVNASNDEVCAIDHLGVITCIGNLTFTNTANGYGFFRFVGSQATKVTTGWFTNLFAESVNSTIVNSTNINKGGSPVNSTTELQEVFLETEADPSWGGNLSQGITGPLTVKGNLNVTNQNNFTLGAYRQHDNGTCLNTYRGTTLFKSEGCA